MIYEYNNINSGITDAITETLNVKWEVHSI